MDMNVAIIGAGIAGLSCAYELERYGIKPDIYEKNNQLGNLFEHTVCALRITDKIAQNPQKYFKKKYGLTIKPLFPLTEIHMLSQKKQALITGGVLGHVFKQGKENHSIENQIARVVTSPIYFNADVDFSTLRNNYDFVVCANGTGKYAKELNSWEIKLITHSRIAKVLGNFNPGTIKMWVNTEYSKNCYCYLLPTSSKEANLVLSLNTATHRELDFYWKEFLLDAEIDYVITETWDAEFEIGHPTTVQIENIYFVGNAGGFIDDFLGFGVLKSVESGLLAGRAIAKGLDYNELVKPLRKNIQKLHQYRDAVNSLDNKGYDRLITCLGLPVIKHIIYKNPLYLLQQNTNLFRLHKRRR
jgi:digeranylgeranylglycerophospholipid reductase